MKITENQIQRVKQVISSLPIAFLKQAQEINPSSIQLVVGEPVPLVE
tara:strand:- start:302 stop:442 length:141 start_codon:yes stop_codon:yes gene_type:complete